MEMCEIAGSKMSILGLAASWSHYLALRSKKVH